VASVAHKMGLSRALALATTALATTGLDMTALDVLVDELPREEIPALKGRLEVRFCREALNPPSAPPLPAPRGLLDSAAAGAYLGGRSADWIRRQVRAGQLRPTRNDGTRSRMAFDVAELERWKAAHSRVAGPLADSYSRARGKPRPPPAPHRARVDAAATRPRTRRHRQHGRPLGAGRPCDAGPGGAVPLAPRGGTWDPPRS
jgi:hypothetical protein